jgi:hypothetical protein
MGDGKVPLCLTSTQSIGMIQREICSSTYSYIPSHLQTADYRLSTAPILLLYIVQNNHRRKGFVFFFDALSCHKIYDCYIIKLCWCRSHYGNSYSLHGHDSRKLKCKEFGRPTAAGHMFIPCCIKICSLA